VSQKLDYPFATILRVCVIQPYHCSNLGQISRLYNVHLKLKFENRHRTTKNLRNVQISIVPTLRRNKTTISLVFPKLASLCLGTSPFSFSSRDMSPAASPPASQSTAANYLELLSPTKTTTETEPRTTTMAGRRLSRLPARQHHKQSSTSR
jgi:hypothetical protein